MAQDHALLYNNIIAYSAQIKTRMIKCAIKGYALQMSVRYIVG